MPHEHDNPAISRIAVHTGVAVGVSGLHLASENYAVYHRSSKKDDHCAFLVGDLPVVQTASLALTLHVSRGIT